LQSLEPDLRRCGSRLRYTDLKALKEGRCRAVAAKLRRRATVAVWLMGTATVGLAVANLLRFIEDSQDQPRWRWLSLFQSLLFVGLFIQAFLQTRRARALADRLDALGDAG